MTTVPAGAPEVRISDWLRDGWDIFVSDVGMFILASLIYTVLNSICFPVLYGPLTCGMFLMVFDRMQGDSADVKRLFSGFDYFGQSFLAGLIFFLLALVAWIIFALLFTLCVVPSIIGIALLVLLQTAFLFVFQLIVERGLGATDAISESYNKVKENFWQFVLFGFVLWLISMAGYSFMLGWLVTTPLTIAASAVAYRELFGVEGPPSEQQPEQV